MNYSVIPARTAQTSLTDEWEADNGDSVRQRGLDGILEKTSKWGRPRNDNRLSWVYEFTCCFLHCKGQKLSYIQNMSRCLSINISSVGVCVDVLSDLIHDEEPFPPLNAFNFLSAIIFSDILSLFPLFILRITPRRLSRTHIVAVQ